MTHEQLERRLRQLEQATKGLDYVRVQDEVDAREDEENAAKSEKKSDSQDTTDSAV